MKVCKGLVMLICMVGFTIVFTGCTPKESKGETRLSKDRIEESQSMNDITNMTLSGISYYNENGMVYGENCSIDLSEKELISAYVFHADEETSEYLTKEHVSISEEQWKQASEAVMVLAPLLQEIPESKGDLLDMKNQVFQATDGPQSEELALTWRNEEDIEVKHQYYIPQDLRVNTLIDILMEIADPIGREIIYYEEPTLVGIYFYNNGTWLTKRGAFSYQLCNIAKGNETEKWMLYASYGEDGKKQYLSETLSADEWPKVRALCDELNVESLPRQARDSRKSMTLYFSDQRQYSVRPDDNTLQVLKEYFDKLADEFR